MRRFTLIEQPSPQVRIERGGQSNYFRVMVNHRNGSGWTRHDDWGFGSLEDAREYVQRRLPGLLDERSR